MECIDFEARLQDALDERRRPEENAALLEHTRDCPACRGLAQSLGLVLDVVAGLPTPPVPADISRRVLSELERPPVVRIRPLRRWVALGAAAAAIAALSIPLGYWIGRQNAGSRGTQPLAAGQPATDTHRRVGTNRPEGDAPAAAVGPRNRDSGWPRPFGPPRLARKASRLQQATKRVGGKTCKRAWSR